MKERRKYDFERAEPIILGIIHCYTNMQLPDSDQTLCKIKWIMEQSPKSRNFHSYHANTISYSQHHTPDNIHMDDWPPYGRLHLSRMASPTNIRTPE